MTTPYTARTAARGATDSVTAPMPSATRAVGTTLRPDPDHRRQVEVDSLGLGPEPRRQARQQPGGDDPAAAEHEPPAEQRRPPGRSGQQVHQPPRRLLLERGPDLARGRAGRPGWRRAGTRRRSTGRRSCPGPRSSRGCRPGSPAPCAVVSLATIPRANAAAAAPAHQAPRRGSSRRAASPNGERSPKGRSGETSRDASTPSPTSRREARTAAVTPRTTAVAAGGQQRPRDRWP